MKWVLATALGFFLFVHGFALAQDRARTYDQFDREGYQLPTQSDLNEGLAGLDLLRGVRLPVIAGAAAPVWLGSDNDESEQAETGAAPSHGPAQQEAADEQ